MLLCFSKSTIRNLQKTFRSGRFSRKKGNDGDIYWVVYPICLVQGPYGYSIADPQWRRYQVINVHLGLKRFSSSLRVRFVKIRSLQLSDPRKQAAKEASKDPCLSPHWRRVLELARRLKATIVESYGDNTASELQYGSRGSQIIAHGMVCVLSGEIYMVFSSVGVDAETMHGHDIVLDKCPSYDLIASKSLPLWREQCIVKDNKVPSFAGTDESPLSLSGVL